MARVGRTSRPCGVLTTLPRQAPAVIRVWARCCGPVFRRGIGMA